ncbi:hypothetical protein [Streptomyces netropsis]|uniref:Lipoprotein n=1 Tax=Streptomyces netropsis TaxID=55404 RepID=A0A7W7PI48_STRNE|nr:hypothetical protein [Streptomyces netropsis]MBB4889430.1 hypothetical protein [Streptomyces netropsis]GGR40029.1 hypothetical protein GCM10010219_51590 [Streptomyces netropsis]
MHRRLTTPPWGLSILVGALLATSGCTTGSVGAAPAAGSGERTAAPADRPAAPAPTKPARVAELRRLLLTTDDLGGDYTAQPSKDDAKDDDEAVSGCPAMERLATRMPGLQPVNQAEVQFMYGSSGFGEELDSDSPAKLSATLREMRDAFRACPSYTVTSGTTPLPITLAEAVVPELGDERYAFTLKFVGPGGASEVKQIAVRKGNILLHMSGSPGLVDKHLKKAYEKATAG